ncbi:hypothetical protein GCM10011369_36110 [Neiella marina]|uniref:Uncharacterized protein n=1 Tax=Neiella marina TaxID=508461 RepID=A0A8J2UAL1_9GAMM|nr:hypothetical protein [Neiella marina]GGA90779.1 hypothetical protein GCM10011369_36110 [Neiella marina]
MEICPECDGAGFLVLVGSNGQQSYREVYSCALCGGSGTISGSHAILQINARQRDVNERLKEA